MSTSILPSVFPKEMLRIYSVLPFLRHTPLRAGSSPTAATQIFKTRPVQRITSPQRHLLSTRTKPTFSLSSPARCRPLPSPRARNVRQNSGKSTAPATTQEAGNQAPRSISERFKDLSRKYGWAAAGVYLGLSVLDFPFCFLAVRLIGPDRIGEAEHAVVDGFWNLVGTVMPSMRPEERAAKKAETTGTEVAEAQRRKENASIWTQLLLAYGVHKSLIFFRVPLTAAITPKVVKTLRSWGWNIGKAGKSVKA